MDVAMKFLQVRLSRFGGGTPPPLPESPAADALTSACSLEDPLEVYRSSGGSQWTSMACL
jgi:hypothetical protein